MIDDGESFADDLLTDVVYDLDLVDVSTLLLFRLVQWATDVHEPWDDLWGHLFAAIADGEFHREGIRARVQLPKADLLEAVQGVAENSYHQRPYFRLAFIMLVIHTLDELNSRAH
jgi:hypothetical protein